ncbi:hypothetical protein W97_05074 [Coniosporium apollinis CBS 100218]|uniref:Uncharacterized protein n=1 Tax=Coniosporium apollinis (strain CBS 100218) TaxID=1168221 RepID=R7YV99_CONA1|nr:uncharacterized protein W97_05074 [Coniosporium apollinis CBS 100218]EON65832.1 hypothetical protein W97_05074 [Coniosporium apollinis CBS 100218]
MATSSPSRLLEDILAATSPAERRRKTDEYYELMLAGRSTPRLLRALEDLSAMHSMTMDVQRNVPSNDNLDTPSRDQSEKRALLSLPNEILGRILHFVFCESAGHIPVHSHTSLHHIVSPEVSKFQQTAGLLALDSLAKLSPLSLSADPLVYIRNLRINFDLPPIVHILWPAIQRRGPGFGYRDLPFTHPYLTTGASMDEKADWYLADMRLCKADYHLSVLDELPFNNFHRLELGFGGLRTHNSPDCAWLWAVCIGKYLRCIRIRRRTRQIGFPGEERDIVRVIKAILETGSPRAAAFATA